MKARIFPLLLSFHAGMSEGKPYSGGSKDRRYDDDVYTYI